MRSLKRICTIFFVLAIVFPTYYTFGQDQKKEEHWTGILGDGTKINFDDLKRILADHNKWVDTDGKEGKRANLRGADLKGANLQRANLSKANFQLAILEEANLQGANLELANLQLAMLSRADLQEADLELANLRGATLGGTNLQEANMMFTNLQKAYLSNTNLRGVFLGRANLQEAYLSNANLQGANLIEAKLRNALFELATDALPNIPSIAKAYGLPYLSYQQLPHSLVELREAFKKSGLRKQEREVTYAIKHTGFIKAKSDGNLLTKIEVCLGWFFFELTCQWGMSPERPLFILAGFIVFFMCFYVVALVRPNKKDGIWKIWVPERVRKDLPQSVKDNRPIWRKKRSETNQPELLYRKNIFSIFGYGIYFSILSAFHMGWRDLNVGNWIARMQPREYRLQASGWVRLLSGLQSLISVYLLALSVLTYFGRPFESY